MAITKKLRKKRIFEWYPKRENIRENQENS